MDFFAGSEAGDGFARGARSFWQAYGELKAGFGEMEPQLADGKLRALAGEFAKAFAGQAEASDLEKAGRFAEGGQNKAQKPAQAQAAAKAEVSSGGGLSLVEIILSMGLMGSVVSMVFVVYPHASDAARAQNMASELGMAQAGAKSLYAGRGSYEGISAKLMEKAGVIRPGSALAAMPAAGGKGFALAVRNDLERPCSALAKLAVGSEAEWRLSPLAVSDGANADAMGLSEPVGPQSVSACEARLAREPALSVVAVYK